MTLRLKIVAVLLAALTLVALGVGAISAAFLQGSLTDQVDARLQESAQEIIEELNENGEPNRPSGEFPTPYDARIVTAYGKTIEQLGSIESSMMPRVAPAGLPESDGFEVKDEEGNTWRIAAVALSDDEYLVVGTPITEIKDAVARHMQVSILVATAALLLAGAAGFYLVSRSLQPLASVEKSAAKIAAGDLSIRVPVGKDEETRRLAAALNTMLEKLQTSFEAQRSSEERVRRFVSDASHELRTPLTTIRGFAELAKTESTESSEALTRIEGEAGRMGRLVEDLLLLARLDEQAPLQDEEVDLLLVALDTAQDGRARGGDVHLDGADEELHPVLVRGDNDRVRQVAANLLSNALEHSPSGTSVYLSVGTEEGWGTLTVTDQGPGMDEAAARRAFDRFYRADPSRARKTGGAGLGLSIVKAVVEALHGRVELTTSPGRGASFKVYLPLSR